MNPPEAVIPSPTRAVWELGPIPIRAYALAVLAGIVVACWITDRRLRARGAPRYAVLDIAIWAVPAGIVGARIYHVLTDWGSYFGPAGQPAQALRIWDGGLGIWGAVAGGALGAWVGARRAGIPLIVVADAAAPGLPLAQAIGRWGNWFNQELMGRPTGLPWAVRIDAAHRPPGYEQFATFQPTFLYESLWDIAVAVLVFLVDRRFRLGGGRAFALYVMAYTAGRGWVESLRIDTGAGPHLLGLRFNDWTSIVVFLGALAYFLLARGTRPATPDTESTTRQAEGQSS